MSEALKNSLKPLFEIQLLQFVQIIVQAPEKCSPHLPIFLIGCLEVSFTYFVRRGMVFPDLVESGRELVVG